MSAFGADDSDDRDLIPRWRTFAATARSGELGTTVPAPVDSDLTSEPIEALRAFDSAPGRYTAGDVLSQLKVRGTPSTDFEARMLALGLQLPNRDLDRQVHNGSPVERSAAAIANARWLLKRHPRNTVAHLDLALAHTVLGQAERAARHIRIALSLAPDNRFVVRSASRFFVHMDDPEQAHAVVAASPRTRKDPWLLATALATAHVAFGKSIHGREARELLIGDHSPRALSELAAELGTHELRGGRDRRGRELFRLGLQDPNENAVAQAAHMSAHADLRVDPAILDIERGYEARTITLQRAGLWQEASREAQQWQEDQPFSIDPALAGTYTAALGAADYKLAIEIGTVGLRSHPNDAMLRNNLAFAFASSGDVASAKQHASHSRDVSMTEHHYVVQATWGLIEFRDGRTPEARALYRTAIEGLNAVSHSHLAMIASLLWALEEVRLGAAVADVNTPLRLAREASALYRGGPLPEITTLAERLDRELLISGITIEDL